MATPRRRGAGDVRLICHRRQQLIWLVATTSANVLNDESGAYIHILIT
jgi:hypothetical protein